MRGASFPKERKISEENKSKKWRFESSHKERVQSIHSFGVTVRQIAIIASTFQAFLLSYFVPCEFPLHRIPALVEFWLVDADDGGG